MKGPKRAWMASAKEDAGGERRQLLQLMGARLALWVVVLAVALTVVGVHEGAEASERGLYGSMAAAFLATMLYALCFRFVTRLRRFATLQVATDVALLSALVYFSGAKDSIFTFLYVPLIVYAARLFGRPGAYASACAASLAYGGMLVGVDRGWLPGLAGPPVATGVPWFTLWGLHSGAWLLVALLASALSRELHRAGRELDRRNVDLQRLQQLHARTVESLTSGLLTTDPAGRITSFNPEAERITGRAPEQALGLDLEEVLPGVRRDMAESQTRAAFRLRARLRFRRANGEELHLGVATSVLRDERGEPGGHVVIFQDVTEVVRMEAELRRSERLAAVGELAARMAHEVRNPLASISGSIQMLRGHPEGGGEDPEGSRLMEIVLRETDRLDALISEFLRFARPAPPKFGPVDLKRLVEDVLEVFAGTCPQGVEVTGEVGRGVQLWADADQLRQLLWNLLLNAVQAMPEGGRVWLTARNSDGPSQEDPGRGRRAPAGEGSSWVEISVADSGTGIAPEMLERIFEPFFTTRPAGSGLGLATVHRIVEAHGGTLRAESTPGSGTVFHTMLPAWEGGA